MHIYTRAHTYTYIYINRYTHTFYSVLFSQTKRLKDIYTKILMINHEPMIKSLNVKIMDNFYVFLFNVYFVNLIQ